MKEEVINICYSEVKNKRKRKVIQEYGPDIYDRIASGESLDRISQSTAHQVAQDGVYGSLFIPPIILSWIIQTFVSWLVRRIFDEMVMKKVVK